MKTTVNTLGALLFGAGIGFIAGILLAPDSGAETRRKLKKGARNMTEDLKENFSAMLTELSESTTREHANQQEEYDMLLGI